MDHHLVEDLLRRIQEGSLSVSEGVRTLSSASASNLGYARIDHHRRLRQGMPEVVFGEGKSAEHLDGIISALKEAGHSVLVTRVDTEKARAVQGRHPDLRYASAARALVLSKERRVPAFERPVAVVTAGTSDEGVAEEACETLALGGAEVTRFYDVGVAGIHRLFSVIEEIEDAPAVICIAGMEGALPSVVGGLVRCPVVAVPTSVGYGTSLGGLTALLAMLTGCAAGVTVVNIDNGFGAAMAVLRLSQTLKARSPSEEVHERS